MDKWEETKTFIKSLPISWKSIIEEKMREAPERVKIVTDRKKGKLWEYYFKYNGFDCFITAQEFEKSSWDDLVRYLAFNTNGECIVREPLKEELL